MDLALLVEVVHSAQPERNTADVSVVGVKTNNLICVLFTVKRERDYNRSSVKHKTIKECPVCNRGENIAQPDNFYTIIITERTVTNCVKCSKCHYLFSLWLKNMPHLKLNLHTCINVKN